MSTRKGMLFACLPALVLLALPTRSSAGLISFTGDSALVSALGTSLSTGVNTLAIGQTVNIPFSATVAGIESVSGTVVLTSNSNGGAIRLDNVVFSVLGATTTNVDFGISVTQVFAYSGPSSLIATESANGFARFTRPGTQFQPGDVAEFAKQTFQPSIKPDNGSISNGIVPFGFTTFAFPDEAFPIDKAFSPLSQSITGIQRTTSNPVSLTFGYSANINTFNANTGAGTSNTLTTGSFGFAGVPSAVPEPASLAMVGIGLASVALCRSRSRRV